MSVGDKAMVARLELELYTLRDDLAACRAENRLLAAALAEAEKESPKIAELRDQLKDMEEDVYEANRDKARAEEREDEIHEHYRQMNDEARYLIEKLERVLTAKPKPKRY